MEMKVMLNTKEACRFLGISQSTWYRIPEVERPKATVIGTINGRPIVRYNIHELEKHLDAMCKR